MLLSEFLEQWSNTCSNNRAPRTVESYRAAIRLYILPALGRRKLKKLRRAEIEAMLAEISGSGHTRTAQNVYVVLKCALSEAVSLGLIDKHPMATIKKPSHRQQMRAYLGPEDLAAYVRAAMAHRHAVAWLLALLCGLRRGEICGLRWSDVDLERGVIHVRNQRIRAAGQLLDTPPKSAAGVRTLPIPEGLGPLLAQLRQPSGYVVPITPESLDREHRALCKSCGIPPVSPHGLRHTMATQAIRQGVHIKVLQSLLGHASFATTANIYAHVDAEMQRTALASVASSVLQYAGR